MPALWGPGRPFASFCLWVLFSWLLWKVYFPTEQAFKEKKHFIFYFIFLNFTSLPVTVLCRFIEGAHLFFMLKSIVSDIQQEF